MKLNVGTKRYITERILLLTALSCALMHAAKTAVVAAVVIAVLLVLALVHDLRAQPATMQCK